MKKLWRITYWINEPEYKSSVDVWAVMVTKKSELEADADGVRLSFPEAITEIEIVADTALDDPQS